MWSSCYMFALLSCIQWCTEADAPENGGLNCNWLNEENSQQCSVRCNAGYALSSRVHEYEVCGPATNYTWSFQLANRSIGPCVGEHFPSYMIEARSSYFARDCHNLTNNETEEIKVAFSSILNQTGVCGRRGNRSCNVKTKNITCRGRNSCRFKICPVSNLVDVFFEIEPLKIGAKRGGCGPICIILAIVGRVCWHPCGRSYMRFMRFSASYANRNLEQLRSRERESMSFTAANRTFETVALYVSDIIMRCPDGMETRGDKCVPCEKGSFLEFGQTNCSDCPIGTFQPLRQMTNCFKCPTGTTTMQPGATVCRDIPGCDDNDCHPNVTCTDVPAPGIGYTCGPCPVGFHGDGRVCFPLDK